MWSFFFFFFFWYTAQVYQLPAVVADYYLGSWGKKKKEKKILQSESHERQKAKQAKFFFKALRDMAGLPPQQNRTSTPLNGLGSRDSEPTRRQLSQAL